MDQAFNRTLLSGSPRQAVIWATGREGGGVLIPDDFCTKTGCPVKDALQENHPLIQDIDYTHPNNSTFEI